MPASSKTIEKQSKQELWLEIQEKIADKKVYIKEHKSDSQTLYAFADPELIGQKIKNKTITFRINPYFYEGKLIPLTDAIIFLRKHPSCNIVGRLAYYAGKLGIVDARSILWLKDTTTNRRVPHLMLMRT